MNTPVNIHKKVHCECHWEPSQRSFSGRFVSLFTVNLCENVHGECSQETSQTIHREHHCDDYRAGYVTLRNNLHKDFTVNISVKFLVNLHTNIHHECSCEGSLWSCQECSQWMSLRLRSEYAVNTQWIRGEYAVNTQWLSLWVPKSFTWVCNESQA